MSGSDLERTRKTSQSESGIFPGRGAIVHAAVPVFRRWCAVPDTAVSATGRCHRRAHHGRRSARRRAHFELNERVFSFTRRFEHLQLDEWPIIAFVLALCLMWMSWRRYRHALLEIQARQAAEARLTEVLEENRALARQSLLSIEAERKHLARELHDELGQYLNAIKIDAVAMTDGQGVVDAKMSQRMLAAVDHIYGVVSDMIRRLRLVGLDELGLTAAVESCIEQWQERLPRTVLALQAHGELEGFSEHANLTIYRLVQRFSKPLVYSKNFTLSLFLRGKKY